MTHDPIRRRFGHGAARLPIGSPTDGPSLSELAQAPVARESQLTWGPPVAFIALAALLFSIASPPHDSLPTARPLAPEEMELAGDPPLEIQLWDDPVSPVAPVGETPPDTAPKAQAPALAATSAPAVPPAEAESGSRASLSSEAERETRFDARELGLAGGDSPLSRPDPGTAGPPEATRGAFPSSARSARPLESAGTHPRLALALDSPTRAAPAPLLSQAAAGLPTGRDAARPAAGAAAGRVALDALARTAHTTRTAFVANALAEDAASGAETAARRSPVSAAAPSRARSNAARDRLKNGGWQQVPLDTLPDCSPPGRQDELKKRILRAAPFERACSHPDGSYRFVETRNLGAFLMWSRSNPDAFTRPQRDRDVCDVLERALRCLAAPSTEEF